MTIRAFDLANDVKIEKEVNSGQLKVKMTNGQAWLCLKRKKSHEKSKHWTSGQSSAYDGKKTLEVKSG